MHINRNCQICETRPRERAILHDGRSVWLLCGECVKHPSKFSIGIDVTKDWNVTAMMLRDIHKSSRPHSGLYERAFLFKSATNLYMKVPDLPYDYYSQKVIQMQTGKVAQIGHDTVIELLPWVDFDYHPSSMEELMTQPERDVAGYNRSLDHLNTYQSDNP